MFEFFFRNGGRWKKVRESIQSTKESYRKPSVCLLLGKVWSQDRIIPLQELWCANVQRVLSALGCGNATKDVLEWSTLCTFVYGQSLQILSLAKQCVLYGSVARPAQQCCPHSRERQHQSALHVCGYPEGGHVSLRYGIMKFS